MTSQSNDNLPAPPVQARKLMLSVVGLFEATRKLGFAMEAPDDQARKDQVTVAGMELEYIVNRLRSTPTTMAHHKAPYLTDAVMARAMAEIVECGRDLGYAGLIPMDESRVTKIAGVVAGLERVLRRIWGETPHTNPEPEAIAA